MPLLSFSKFLHSVSQHLRLIEATSGELSLRGDLGLSEFDIFILVLYIEKLAKTHAEISSTTFSGNLSEYPVLFSINDAYELYRDLIAEAQQFALLSEGKGAAHHRASGADFATYETDAELSRKTPSSVQTTTTDGPQLTGRWTELVLSTPESKLFSYRLGLEQPDFFKWRWLNHLPNFEEYSTLPGNALMEFVVRVRRTHNPIGIAMVRDPMFEANHAQISLSLVSELHGSGIATEALLLLLNYTFKTWNFRKIYCEVQEHNIPLYPVSEFGFVREGTFKKKSYSFGRLRDVAVLSITRASAENLRERIMEIVDAGNDSPPRAIPEADCALAPLSNVLSGHWVELTPILAAHIDFLYDLAMNPEDNFRWRFRGAQIDRRTFQNNLWKGILCQFLITTRRSKQPLGQVVAYGSDLQAGYTYIGSIVAPKAHRSGLSSEAVEIFITYIQRTWRIDRFYFETPRFNFPQFRTSLDDEILQEEAVFREHNFYDGELWGMHHFSLTPSRATNILPRKQMATEEELP
jgi:RimJ/RimL family protein N-acetyltransferase